MFHGTHLPIGKRAAVEGQEERETLDKLANTIK